MKKILLFFIALAASIGAKAQGYNYSKYGLEFTASSVRPYADMKIANDTYAFGVTGYYNLTPYVPVGLELQMGKLAGGSTELDYYKRQYRNNYMALMLHGDLQLGEIIDYSRSRFVAFFKDFYIGSGVGFMFNNMAFIQRTNLVPDSQYPVGTYRFPGDDKSVNLMVPIRIGYEVKIFNDYDEPYMAVTLGYNHSFTWGEGMDGYTDPPSGFKNNALDQYRQIVIGLKLNFGGTRPSYTKSIRY